MSASSTTSLGTDALAPGTELIVDRLAYRHHGIYLGEGRVHVGRRPAESLHGEAIVRRARSRLGERRYVIFRKCLLRFSLADPAVPTVWESRAVSGGRC
jgi:hypothetical protein